MRIKIRPYLSIRKAMGDCACVEMELDGITIRQLLQELSLRYGRELLEHLCDNEDSVTRGRTLILVNGRNLRNLPHQLDTKLQDGDEVVLFPPAMGG